MATVYTELLKAPISWKGSDFKDDQPWVLSFTPEHLEDLDKALTAVKASHKSLSEITVEDFPLPRMGGLLSQVQNELRDGLGFTVLRGFPVDNYTEEDSTLAYWGMGLHLGTPVSQKATGDLLVHVRDTGLDIHDSKVRGHQTNELLQFHTDSADIDYVGLLCLQTAKEGGLSSISSVAAVHNELLTKHPEYLRILYGPYSSDLRDAAVPGAETREQPVFASLDGRVTVRYQRQFIESAQGKSSAIPLSSVQREALDILDEIVSRDDVRLDLEFQRGDVQFLNNSRVLHSRTKYIDDADPKLRRHLLRLWLNDPGSYPLPPEHSMRRAGVTPVAAAG